MIPINSESEMDRRYKIIVSLCSIIPTVVADLLILFERLQVSFIMPIYVDVFIVAINIAWWLVVGLFNYIIWKGKLILTKKEDK